MMEIVRLIDHFRLIIRCLLVYVYVYARVCVCMCRSIYIICQIIILRDA